MFSPLELEILINAVSLLMISHNYKDLFSRDFELGEQPGGNGKPNMLKVDILDTAGDAQFPAMRR